MLVAAGVGLALRRGLSGWGLRALAGLVVLAALVVVLTLTSKLTSGIQSSAERNLPRQLSLLGITMIGIVLIVGMVWAIAAVV